MRTLTFLAERNHPSANPHRTGMGILGAVHEDLSHEMNLMCIYNTGSRTGLIDSLREMRGELSPEETELRELTDSALTKLCAMTDEDFAQLELYPDFDQ